MRRHLPRSRHPLHATAAAVIVSAALLATLGCKKEEKAEAPKRTATGASTSSSAPATRTASSPATPAGTPQALPQSAQNLPPKDPVTGLYPQPEGPPPTGMVWSPEHGHWHLTPGSEPHSLPGVQVDPETGLYPQPEGPVPPGHVWSPQHGHWHDVPRDSGGGHDH